MYYTVQNPYKDAHWDCKDEAALLALGRMLLHRKVTMYSSEGDEVWHRLASARAD